MMLRRITVALAVLLACSSALAQQPGNAALAPDELPAHLVKILRTTNKAQTNRYIPKVYELKHVNPYQAVRFYRRVMEIEEGSWHAWAREDLESGKVLLVMPEYQEPYVDEMMKLVDVPLRTTSGGTNRLYYMFKHRDVSDPNIATLHILAGSNESEIVADPQNNAVMLEDTPGALPRTARATEIYDIPTPQVEVNATVYEIAVNDDHRLGLDYVSWKNGPGRSLFAIGAFAEREKISTLSGPNPQVFSSGKGTAGLPGREFHTTGRNGVYLYDVPSAYFDFLVARGQANILTESKLVALHRSTALLEVGEDILFYQEKSINDPSAGIRTQAVDPFGNIDNHPDDRVIVPTLTERALGEASTGFFMQFTPFINQSNVELDLFLSIVNLTGFADDGTPVLAARTMDSTLKIPHDMREITVGGLVRKRRVDSANKIPWLGSIPVLGTLFGGESKLDQNTYVVCTLKVRTVGITDPHMNPNEERLMRIGEGLEDPEAIENRPGFLDT